MSAPSSLDTLLQIQQRALQAGTLPALRFTVVNETHALAPYRQAALLGLRDGVSHLEAASGLVSVANDSPYVVWLNRFARRWPQDGQAHALDFADAAPEDAQGWEEWLPDHLLLVPLKDRLGRRLATVMYARETPWSEAEQDLLLRLHATYGYCYGALSAGAWRPWKGLRSLLARRHRWKIALAVLAALCIPVRLSALAPAEVTALDAIQVSAPQDGVVGAFAVAPNARVKTGDLLFSLDDSTLLNRRQVAIQALAVARADAHIAQQRAFDDVKSKADVAVAMGRVREKEAELAAVDAQAQRVEIRADRDGVAIYGDPNDWIGRPVQTGERVMQLAQPEDAGVLIWLAVPDAINLDLGAPIKLFLHTDPLRPLAGHLVETSYQAIRSPEDVASYRLRARFDQAGGEALPRIGLRGTARISGEWVPLAYSLFRRPIAAVREWTGL